MLNYKSTPLRYWLADKIFEKREHPAQTVRSNNTQPPRYQPISKLIIMMKSFSLRYSNGILVLGVFFTIGFIYVAPTIESTRPTHANEISSTEKLHSTLSGQDIESLAAYDVMMQVISHRRCLNCHPSGEIPLQGEEGRLHNFGVQRGEHGLGTAALTCKACHQAENNNLSGVPGVSSWHLAPRSMGWDGLTRKEIALALIDPEKNGGRNLAAIEHHLSMDPLVRWAFEPGINHEGIPREKPPVSQEAFVAAVKTWIAAGAPIPED